jgi:hypothetical protein
MTSNGGYSRLYKFIQPPPSKRDKQQVPRSPHKQPVTKIILPCIPDGIRVESDLLGHIDKLKYSYHDVANIEKFPEFVKRVYLEIVGINLIGELIDQPLRWKKGLQKTWNIGLLYLPHFGRGRYVG